MRLVRNWLAAILELEHRNNDNNEHDDTDDSRHCKNWLLQVVNLLRIRTFGCPCVLGCVTCTSREHSSSANAIQRQLQATKHGCQPIEAILGVSEGGFVNHGTTTSMRWPLNPATSREKSSPATAGLGMVNVSDCSAP